MISIPDFSHLKQELERVGKDDSSMYSPLMKEAANAITQLTEAIRMLKDELHHLQEREIKKREMYR